ncbi:MAG: hypothetical protein IMZ44_03715 [Planctomycetes bacterium]|nr:hypothetical protein [Planctomycetota bacterium]
MIMSRIHAAGSLAGAVLGLALLTSGCGGSSGPAQQAGPTGAPAATTPSPAQQAPASDATLAAAAAAGQPAPPAATVPAPAGVAVTAPPPVQDYEIAGVQVALVEVKRTSGDTVTVKWQYRNTTDQEIKISKGGSSWSDVYQLTADAYLIDAVNKKKYLVIKDSQNYWVASKHGDWQGATIGPGQSLNAWAKFPAPPAAVETIAVNIPGTAPFEGVPIVK